MQQSVLHPQGMVEAALNGPWSRERQPGIPITVQECIRDGLFAADAGAAIIHVHAYDPATGRQNGQWGKVAAISGLPR